MNREQNIEMKNSIQTRLSGVMVLVLAFMIAINIFIFMQINNAVRRIDAVFSSNVTINELANTLELVQETVHEYLNTKSTQALENYYRYEQDYRELLTDLNEKNVDSEVKILEKNIRKMSESYLDQTNHTVQAKRGRNVEKYKESYEKETLLFRYINSYIYRLNNEQFRQNSVNYQLLLSEVGMLEKISLFILVVVFGIGIVITMLWIRQLYQPLRALADTAYEVAEGNLNVPLLPVVEQDEIGVVTQGFNQMLISIRDYIDRFRESLEKEAQMKERELSMEAHLKEAQLKFLQAQINPHFLFNSLNAGTQLALMEDADNTAIFLEKMADFFRYNVRKMSDEATLFEEIAAVDNYIYILNVRFAGDITYIKEVDEDLSNIPLPSMILQPIVENAVHHGIHDCMDTGWIRLNVHQEGNQIRIIIRDNGKGMTREMIRAVMKGRKREQIEEKDSTGIAMENVIHRLELYYNQKDLLKIESDGPGTGTMVEIVIPLERESNRI